MKNRFFGMKTAMFVAALMLVAAMAFAQSAEEARRRNTQMLHDMAFYGFLDAARNVAREANRIPYVIVNSTGQSIQEIYISDSSTDTWGRNQWQSQDLLPTGYQVEVKTDDVGPYNIMVVDTRGNQYVKQKVRITSNLVVNFTQQDKVPKGLLDKVGSILDSALGALSGKTSGTGSAQPNDLTQRTTPAPAQQQAGLKTAYEYNARGNEYYAKRDYDKAIADFTESIKLSPNEAYAYSARGHAYFWGKKDYDRAITDYSQAIRLDQNNATYYFDRGYAYYNYAYYNKKDYDRTIADYTQAIRLDQNNANYYAWRGFIYKLKGEYDRVIADYTQAIRLDQNNASYYSDRADAYSGKGMYDRAIEDYTAAIKINPNYGYAFNARAYAYKGKGMYDRAIEDVNAALLIQPNNANLYDSRGEMYLGKGMYDQSIADYERALRINPNFASAKEGLERAKRRGR